MRFFHSLRGRLLLLVGLALVPLLGLLLLARDRLAETARAEWREDAVRLAETAATGHTETLRRTQWLLEALARVPSASEPDSTTCAVLFSDFYASRDYYTAFGLVGLDGRTRCTEPARDPMDLSDRPYFQGTMATRRTTLSDYHVGHITGRPVVTMATPVFGPDSTVVAVLAAGIGLSRLDPLPEGLALPHGAHVSLLDGQGRVLYHAPDSVTIGATIPPEVMSLAYANDDDTVASIDVAGIGLRTYAMAVVDIPGQEAGARILVSFDPDFVGRQIDEAAATSYLGILLGALVLVLGLWAAVELMVLRRIASLARAAERLGRGELQARSGVGDGDDEIARLGRAFDDMAANLETARRAEADYARRQIEASEKRLELLAETIDEVFWIWNPHENRYEYLSPAFDTIWGVPRERLLEDAEVWHESMHPEDRARLQSRLVDAGTLREGEHEYRIVRPDGEVRWITSRTFAARNDDGEIDRYLGVAQDVTEHKALEEALLHATKLEAVGRLAGGVAHDFNNILTAIQGHARFMQETLPEDHEVRDDLDEISTGVQRAAGLTRQLLTFSRKQDVRTRVLDLNRVIRGTSTMIGRLIGEDVELVFDLSPDVPLVNADPHQIEQVLMNLVVNARDAMPRGGTVVVETRHQAVEAPEAATTDKLEPGEYATLRVRDDGRGMDPETLEHVFEPFFTTKPPGEGTGLGLATVYGIVKQSGGAILVESEEGNGTTFCVYLPAVEGEDADQGDRERAETGDSEEWRVLLVEDEASVRAVMTRMLERMGCTVTAAENGARGLEMIESEGCDPDVVVTDVVMPAMTGVEMVARIRETRPELPVVFMSGYPGYELGDDALSGDAPFLQKPFTVDELTDALRRATGSRR